MTPLQKHERITKATAMLKAGATAREVRLAVGYSTDHAIYEIANRYNLPVKKAEKRKRHAGTIAVVRRIALKTQWGNNYAHIGIEVLRAAGLDTETSLAFTCEPGKITLTKRNPL